MNSISLAYFDIWIQGSTQQVLLSGWLRGACQTLAKKLKSVMVSSNTLASVDTHLLSSHRNREQCYLIVSIC
jgi:hypothetical protein